MANLLVKLNRIKDENKKDDYVLEFKSKELNDVKTVYIRKAHSLYFRDRNDKNFRYKDDWDEHGIFCDVEKLEERFRGITKAEVVSKRRGLYGKTIFVLDYTTENFFKKRKMALIAEQYSELKKHRDKEHIDLTKTLVKTLKEKRIEFDEANLISEICRCDKYDLAALEQCIYILQNNIRATKGRYCYGARCVWECLGFKVIKLFGVKGINGNHGSNYAFLTERR